MTTHIAESICAPTFTAREFESLLKPHPSAYQTYQVSRRERWICELEQTVKEISASSDRAWRIRELLVLMGKLMPSALVEHPRFELLIDEWIRTFPRFLCYQPAECEGDYNMPWMRARIMQAFLRLRQEPHMLCQDLQTTDGQLERFTLAIYKRTKQYLQTKSPVVHEMLQFVDNCDVNLEPPGTNNWLSSILMQPDFLENQH